MSDTNGKGKLVGVPGGTVPIAEHDAPPRVLDARQAIMQAARKCRDDTDTLPHAVVIPREGITAAQRFWVELLKLHPCGVQMDVTPDTRDAGLAVLLFSKTQGT